MSPKLSVNLNPPPHADAEIEGLPLALQRFAELLRAAVDNRASMAVSSAGPEVVHTIAVRQCDAPIQIRYLSGVLSFEGAKDKLDILAYNIEFLVFSNPESPHMHIEYYEGHPYIDALSIPLIISRLGPVR
jgi:hypothetical protein